MTIKLSICIICKDEEKKIGKCLESIKWADEIVIIDSGSTDSTLDIALKYTDKIIVREDWEGFGVQRQRAESAASNDWVMVIDCDEIITEALKNEILNLLPTLNDNSVIYLNRLTNFNKQFVHYSGWYPDRIARIYNRTQYRYNGKLVHESLACKGCERVEAKNDLLHFQYDDIYEYINKRNKYAYFNAQDMKLKGKKGGISRALLSSIFSFIRHYILRRGFLDGKVGFIISVIQAQYTFNKYLFAKE